MTLYELDKQAGHTGEWKSSMSVSLSIALQRPNKKNNVFSTVGTQNK